MDKYWEGVGHRGEGYVGYFSIAPTQDGGYVIGYEDNASPNQNFYTVKYNRYNQVEWGKNLTVNRWGQTIQLAQGKPIKQTSDGGYIITGMYGRDVKSGNALLLVKLDKRGNIVWSSAFRRYGSYFNGYLEGNNVLETKDGGFLVLGGNRGSAMGPIPSNRETFLGIFKFNNLGRFLWGKEINVSKSSLELETLKSFSF